jgi:hypothetical protein
MLVEKVHAGLLRASGSRGLTREAPAEMLWGSGRSENHRRRGIKVADGFHLWRHRAQFRPRQGLGSRISGSRSFLVEWRSCCGPWPGLGCSKEAGPWRGRELGAAEQGGRWRWGGSGRLQCGGRAQGGLKGPIKGEAGDLGVRAPVGIAAVIRAGEADRATARRDPGSGKEASGGRARTEDWLVGSCSSVGWSGATCSDGTAGRNRGSRREEEGKERGGADRQARAVGGRKGQRGLCCAGLNAGWRRRWAAS